MSYFKLATNCPMPHADPYRSVVSPLQLEMFRGMRIAASVTTELKPCVNIDNRACVQPAGDLVDHCFLFFFCFFLIIVTGWHVTTIKLDIFIILDPQVHVWGWTLKHFKCKRKLVLGYRWCRVYKNGWYRTLWNQCV